jgi:hypothetical protein
MTFMLNFIKVTEWFKVERGQAYKHEGNLT